MNIFNIDVIDSLDDGITNILEPCTVWDTMRGKRVELILSCGNADKAQFCEALVSAQIGN